VGDTRGPEGDGTTTATGPAVVTRAVDQDEAAGHAVPSRLLSSHGFLIGVFNALFAGFLLVCRLTGRSIPVRYATGDVILLGVATHKLSRLLTKEKVTASLRAPFTRLESEAGTAPGEVEETARGQGLRRALGELLTCPYCLGMWLSAFFYYGLVLLPGPTRLIGSLLTSLAISDFLQAAYARATALATGGVRTDDDE
jgi:hypothetical protein